MRLGELLLIAVGLSMDAFAVSVCKGLSVRRLSLRHALLAGLWFGGFQFLMPVLGWLVGYRFEALIASVDHWIAFVLLGLIGANMIKESFAEGEKLDDDFGVRPMLLLAVATSIDALAVGVTFAFLDVNIWSSVMIIGVTTCVLSMIGVKVGSVFGAKYEKRAELCGGVILILLGQKILLEHLGIL